MDKNRKMKGDYRGPKRTTWLLWEGRVKPSDIHRPLSAVCGERAPERNTVFNWVYGFNSGKTCTGDCP